MSSPYRHNESYKQMLAVKQKKLLHKCNLFTVYQKSFVMRKYPITKNAIGIKICDTQLKSQID